MVNLHCRDECMSCGIEGGCDGDERLEIMLTEEREHNPPSAKESLFRCWECALFSSVIISSLTFPSLSTA